jgi:hypothetical protein
MASARRAGARQRLTEWRARRAGSCRWCRRGLASADGGWVTPCDMSPERADTYSATTRARSRRELRHKARRSSSWSRRHEVASDALCWLGERTRASGTDWALGTQARPEALLTEGRGCRGPLPRGDPAARSHGLRDHRDRHGLVPRPPVSKDKMLYSEWLPRDNRRATRASRCARQRAARREDSSSSGACSGAACE